MEKMDEGEKSILWFLFLKDFGLSRRLNMRNAIGKGLQSAVDALSDFNSNKM